MKFTSKKTVSEVVIDLEELKTSFNMMKEAFDKPVIDLDSIVYAEVK